MARRRSKRGRRFGAGDLAVLLSLLGLALVFLQPGWSGRRLGAHELSSLRHFLALRTTAIELGLPSRFAELGRRCESLTGIKAVPEQVGLAETELGMHWKDRYFGYALRLKGLSGHGPILLAAPLEPGKTGLVLLEQDLDGEVRETRLAIEASFPLTREDRELLDSNAREAKDNLKALTALILDLGLVEAFTGLREALPPGLDPIDQEIPAAPDLEDEDYLFRFDLSWVGGVLALELLAWPGERGEHGFAAFYGPCPGEVMQTWNLVTPYGGSERVPQAGEARSRHGGKDDRGDWVGYDGNKWFPLTLPETPRR